MPIFTRREFIVSNSALMLASAIPSVAWSTTEHTHGFVISDGSKENGRTDDYAANRVDQTSYLFFSNFAATKTGIFKTPFLVHQTIQHPKKHNLFVGVQKWGKNAVLLDFHTKKLTPLFLPEGHLYFGHGIFHIDSDELFISAMDKPNKKGVLLVYNSKNLNFLRATETHGLNPHDIQLSENKKHFYVMNSGAPAIEKKYYGSQEAILSCLSSIDIATGKLIDISRFEKPHAFGHFTQLSQTQFACMGFTFVSEYNDSSALALLKDKKITNLMSLKELQAAVGECLSGRKILGTNEFVVTFPNSDFAAVIDYERNIVLKKLPAVMPRGVIQMPDSEKLLITQGLGKNPFLEYTKSTRNTRPVDVKNKKRHFSQWTAMGPHATEIIYPA